MYRCVLGPHRAQFLVRGLSTAARTNVRPSVLHPTSYIHDHRYVGNYNLLQAPFGETTTTVRRYGGNMKTDKQIDIQQKAMMDELPVPEGSWQEFSEVTSKRYNIELLASAAALGVTVFIMYKVKCFSFNLLETNYKKVPIVSVTGADKEILVVPELDAIPNTESVLSPEAVAEDVAAPLAEEVAAPPAEESPAPPLEETSAAAPPAEETPVPLTEEKPATAETPAEEAPVTPPPETGSIPPPPEDGPPPPPAAEHKPEAPKFEETVTDYVAEAKAVAMDWSKVPDIPTHVPYLLVGAGTASFAAFRYGFA